MIPVIATLAEALPESDPNRLLATMATLAGPPLYLPIRAKASSERNLPPPTEKRIRPKKIKLNTIVPTTPKGIPKSEPGANPRTQNAGEKVGKGCIEDQKNPYTYDRPTYKAPGSLQDEYDHGCSEDDPVGHQVAKSRNNLPVEKDNIASG
jgi:hypothetical protein